jgi:hypothetical protein
MAQHKATVIADAHTPAQNMLGGYSNAQWMLQRVSMRERYDEERQQMISLQEAATTRIPVKTRRVRRQPRE